MSSPLSVTVSKLVVISFMFFHAVIDLFIAVLFSIHKYFNSMADDSDYGWAGDQEFYKNQCIKHGLIFDEDNEARFCYSVSHQVIDGGCDEDNARADVFFIIHGIKI